MSTVPDVHPSRTNVEAYGLLRPLGLRSLILGPHPLHPIVRAVLLGNEKHVPSDSKCSEASNSETHCSEPQTAHAEVKSVHFFNEHYIVKPPQSESRFCWYVFCYSKVIIVSDVSVRKDAQPLGFGLLFVSCLSMKGEGVSFHRHTDAAEQLMMCYIDPHDCPYVSLWCPLDDMVSANGSLEVWPGSHLRGTEPDETTQGVLLTPAAGSVVYVLFVSMLNQYLSRLFSSTLWHRSGRNTTDTSRRAYYLQYSLEPIMAKEGPVSRAIPILTDSERNVTEKST